MRSTPSLALVIGEDLPDHLARTGRERGVRVAVVRELDQRDRQDRAREPSRREPAVTPVCGGDRRALDPARHGGELAARGSYGAGGPSPARSRPGARSRRSCWTSPRRCFGRARRAAALVVDLLLAPGSGGDLDRSPISAAPAMAVTGWAAGRPGASRAGAADGANRPAPNDLGNNCRSGRKSRGGGQI
jgi:hypothetical protein